MNKQIGIDICPYCGKGPIRPMTPEEAEKRKQSSGRHLCVKCGLRFDQQYVINLFAGGEK